MTTIIGWFKLSDIIDKNVLRCTCGGWAYIGKACEFCGKESKQ
jgi:hypothetical protein